jgi:hypothetical protein
MVSKTEAAPEVASENMDENAPEVEDLLTDDDEPLLIEPEIEIKTPETSTETPMELENEDKTDNCSENVDESQTIDDDEPEIIEPKYPETPMEVENVDKSDNCAEKVDENPTEDDVTLIADESPKENPEEVAKTKESKANEDSDGM